MTRAPCWLVEKRLSVHPTPEEQPEILAHIKQGLDDGALGVGIGITYVPKNAREQILEVFQLAAAYKQTCFVLCSKRPWRQDVRPICNTPSDFVLILTPENVRGCRSPGALRHPSLKVMLLLIVIVPLRYLFPAGSKARPAIGASRAGA